MSMLNKNMCRECFKLYIDPLATDSFLLLGKFPKKCDGCGREKKVVVTYFKYGEHTVTPDGNYLNDSNFIKRDNL